MVDSFQSCHQLDRPDRDKPNYESDDPLPFALSATLTVLLGLLKQPRI
jgi:hypothetical protein